jgi:putative heme-binding domain-containing protein
MMHDPPSHARALFPLLAGLMVAGAPALPGAESGHGADGDPVATVVKLDKEAEHLKSLKLPAGVQARVWADGAMAANPVALDVDAHNRVFAAETRRYKIGGTLDIRAHLNMYLDDLRCTTVADRAAMIKKYQGGFAPGFFTNHSDLVVLFEDTAKLGICDHATVFADGFNAAVDGPAAGILVGANGTIYFACTPTVYALTDSSGAGTATTRCIISDGYGVRVSISGHDLHGLVWGPDGKLYWSMGDQGYDVMTKEGQHLADPVSGGVFRANPDGSELELIYTGLRNPEELAFNEFGDLFTVDNNADFGDKARVTYIVEGGSTGWTHGFSMLNISNMAKAAGLDGVQPDPWMVEGLWKTRFAGQPTHIVPPAGYCTSGPCGLAYVPATGWPTAWAGRFLICDYRAGNDSGIMWFTLKPDGAGYTVNAADKFLWGAPCTDVAFSYDGRLFVSEYLGGWTIADKGRILSLWEPTTTAQSAEVAALIAGGFTGRPLAELSRLLGHVDQRVRQAAQFELVNRGPAGIPILTAAAASGSPFARLHGIWGLGQVGRRNPDVLKALLDLVVDPDAQVRSQAVKTLGDDRYAPAADRLIAALRDSSPRVRAFAAISLGRMHQASAIPALVQVLAENNDQDAVLRHAAVMGLAGSADRAAIEALSTNSSAAVRLGILLTERRLHDAHIAAFLQDADPRIWSEAVRAIYDLPIRDAMPALIAQLAQGLPAQVDPAMSILLSLRLIHAAVRYGGPDAAVALAAYAAHATAPPEIRATALHALLTWDNPLPVDPIVGLYRPVPPRERPLDGGQIRESLQAIIAQGDEKLQPDALTLAKRFGQAPEPKALIAMLDNAGLGDGTRITAIGQLLEQKSADLVGRLPTLLHDRSASVAIAAFDAIVALTPAAAAATARSVLEDDGATAGIPLKQHALSAIAMRTDAAAAQVVDAWLDRLIAGTAPKEIALEISDAAERRTEPAIVAKYARYTASFPANDQLAPFRATLWGGDVQRGRAIFRVHNAQCMRCHAVDGDGGVVGPDLRGVPNRIAHEALLESLILPNAVIAPGYGLSVISLKDGSSITGSIISQSATELVVRQLDAKQVTVPSASVASKTDPVSPMPPMGQIMSKAEIRDVIAYLSSLR